MTAYTGGMPTFTAGVKTGNAARLNQLRDLGRAFTDARSAYTSTLTASTTNPTGWTQTGRWMQAGKLVVVAFKLTAGGSMTPGSGTYRVALPVAANTTLGDLEVGTCAAYDSSSGAYAPVQAYIANSSYIQLGYCATWLGAFATVSSGAPWTWASGDFIRGQITYEAA